MERIDFKDLPDTTTPINASNLNKMQENIEAEMETGIETLTNENGTAIKYSDGTMICYGTVNPPAGQELYNLYYPASFIDANNISINITNRYNVKKTIIYSTGARQKNYIVIYPYDVETRAIPSVECAIYYTVIGKWK